MERRGFLRGLGILVVTTTFAFGLVGRRTDIDLEKELRVIEIIRPDGISAIVFKYQENIWHKIKRTLNTSSGYEWGKDIFIRDYHGYDFSKVHDISYLRDLYPEKKLLSPDELYGLGEVDAR